MTSSAKCKMMNICRTHINVENVNRTKGNFSNARSNLGLYCSILFLGITCVTVSNLTGFPVSEPVGAEVKDKIAVVWECPESQIDQITEFIHCFNVGVFPAGKKNTQQIIKSIF